MITKKITTMLAASALAFASQLSAAETFYVAPDEKAHQLKKSVTPCPPCLLSLSIMLK